jgi:hypothetical protein
MKTVAKLFLVLTVFCCTAGTASGKELIKVFKGSESRYTDEFKVSAPWIVDWHVTSELSPAVEVNLVRAGTGIFVGSVLRTKQTGNGVRLFDEGGRFQFRINSTMANWSLTVEQLTPEEAELYTPITEEDRRR